MSNDPRRYTSARAGRLMRIGILGASRIAPEALIRPSQSIEGIRITGIAARNAKAGLAFASQHGIPNAFASYEDLIADSDIDLVYVSTPPSTHLALALATVKAGKSLLVEKPFALTSAEARQVHEAAQMAGVAVFEAMHSPHHRLFSRVIEIIHSGEIGQVREIEAEFNAPIDEDDALRWSAALGGGALMDLGVYPLAWVRRISGEDFEVTRADADMRKGVDARFTATLALRGGAVAKITSSMLAPDFYARLFVRGTEGDMEVINPLAPQLGHTLTITNGESTRTETLNGPSTYDAQLMAVRDAWRGDASWPFAGDDYVLSMAAIEKVRAAFARPAISAS